MPHHATTLADQAVTAAHQLALLTRPAISTLQVSDLRTVTGALAELAAGLPQTLGQLSRYLPAADPSTATDDPVTGAQDTPADHALTCLRHASAAAAHLAAALDAAHQTLADMGETTNPNFQGVTFQPARRGHFSTGVDSAGSAYPAASVPSRQSRRDVADCQLAARHGHNHVVGSVVGSIDDDAIQPGEHDGGRPADRLFGALESPVCVVGAYWPVTKAIESLVRASSSTSTLGASAWCQVSTTTAVPPRSMTQKSRTTSGGWPPTVMP